MCDSSAAAISVSTGWPAKSSFASAFWPSENVGIHGLRFHRLCSIRDDVRPAVLEPRRPARDRLEREQPVVVRLVDLERDLRVVGAQPVEHRDERVVELVHVAHAVGAPEAVEPHEEVELEVAHAPATRSPRGCGSRRAAARPAPTAPSPASFEPLSGSATFDATSASPTGWHTHSGCCAKVSDDGLKNVGLIHRPSFIGAIASRTAPKLRVREPRPELRLRACRPSAARDTAASPACQSPERACQPSSRMNVSTPIRRAIGAISCTVAKSMSSFAPVEIRFESTPLELNVTPCS